MGINSTEVSYGFGQLGSGYLDDTGALTPPTGKVIVAIQVVAAAKFTTLTADTAQGNDAAFVGTASQVAVNGANSRLLHQQMSLVKVLRYMVDGQLAL